LHLHASLLAFGHSPFTVGLRPLTVDR
jgi:hypothetical protein